MFLRSVLCFVLAMAALAACSAKAESDDSPFDGIGKADTRELQTSNDPLSGLIDGRPWKGARAVALYRDGEYGVVIADEASQLTCANWFPRAPHVQFRVPVNPGSYRYDGSAGGRLVNFVFPYTTPNGGGSDTVLASKSQIDIDGVAGSKLIGRVAALSPVGKRPEYKFAGAFSAEICDGPARPPQFQ